METYLPIAYLNDFIFCPYSIYLHQVFDEGEDETFSAQPQQKGKTAHKPIDKPKTGAKGERGIYVISHKLRLYGKIDVYYPETKKLVELKRNIKCAYKGFYYQIWAQYFCLKEMGYAVDELQLFSIKQRKPITLVIPGKAEYQELFYHVRAIAEFDPFNFVSHHNKNKCAHCVYSSLCDKTTQDHVYA